MLWKELNSESNKLAAISNSERIVHQSKDFSFLKKEMEDEGEDEDFEYVDAEDVEDLEDFEYDEEDWDDEYDGEDEEEKKV